ncbi:MAG: hypothetical protein AAF383_25045 [Cyanobacteria bacterium P01_A01_bin.83]
MKLKNKLNRDVTITISLILLLWFISVLVSRPIFDRPVGWITAHTLVSMRAFEEWGFWKLLGASTLIPKSYEFIGVNISYFTKQEGIYLSYPSLWLVLPYAAFKFLSLLPLNIDLSSQYLHAYNLIVNRLICGVVIYYLYFEIINIIAGDTLTDYQKRLIVFLGFTGWMFTPRVLFWTQNGYFSDQAVLLPIYSIFLISLRCKFKFGQLSTPEKSLLFIASLVACGTDWYGWISVAIILLIVLLDLWLSRNEVSFSPLVFLKQYWNSIKWLLSGMLVAGVTFLAQLLYYRDGFNQIYEIFLKRTGITMGDDLGNALTPMVLLRGIVRYWTAYYPPRLQQIIKPSNYHLIAVLVAALLILGTLYYFFRTSEDRPLCVYVYVLVFLVPLLQLYLLKQHSYIHGFSAFKMGLPISFSLLILPAVLLILIWKKTLSNRNFQFLYGNVYISIFIVSLGLIMIFSSRSGVTKLAGVAGNISQDKGFLVARNIAFDDLPITNHEALVVAPFPPPPLWYTNRFIYSPSQLKNLLSQGKINVENLKKMKPVFLAFQDEPINTNVSKLCEGEWIDLSEKVDGREVISCRSSELHRLFD